MCLRRQLDETDSRESSLIHFFSTALAWLSRTGVFNSGLRSILDLPDNQPAARNLARLVGVTYYAQVFDSWDHAKEQILNNNPERKPQLLQLFEAIEDAKPRLRVSPPLTWPAPTQPVESSTSPAPTQSPEH